MGKTLSVATQKGGVSKTTTTYALACAMKRKGFRVLAVDMDPQGSLSYSLGASLEGSTVYQVLRREVKTLYAIQRSAIVDTISANILLSGVELEYTGKGREFLLKEALAPVKNQYDYILIDTPPGLGILTTNALAASDHVILPMLSDLFSLQGIVQVYETIEHTRRLCNPNLTIAGILLTRYNSRSKLAKEVLGAAQMLAEDLEIPVLKTRIRSSIALSEAQTVQQDPMVYAPTCSASKDYIALFEELRKGGI